MGSVIKSGNFSQFAFQDGQIKYVLLFGELDEKSPQGLSDYVLASQEPGSSPTPPSGLLLLGHLVLFQRIAAA